MQRLMKLIYPAQCLTCDELVEQVRGLCPKCWAETPFIIDPPCDVCGTPLMGDAEKGDLCNDCHQHPRPWKNGRAAMAYHGNARGLVLKLKHGDRTDLAYSAGEWMAETVREIVQPDTIIAPVPLHWRRISKRRYNQSALLAKRMTHLLACEYCPDLLQRPVATPSLGGFNFAQRRETVGAAFRCTPWRENYIKDRHVLLVDDVMTSGATLAGCAETCLQAGASHISVAVLARVALDG